MALRIPRYWAQSRRETIENKGHHYAFQLWGWSDASVEAARQHAQERLHGLLALIRQGQEPSAYSYGERAVREEIIAEIAHPDGSPDVLTRNRYGALILNSEHVLFIDVDFPREGALARLIRSFRGMPSPEEATLQSVRQGLAQHGADAFRIYRTAAGLRVMGTSRTFRPDSSQVQELMQACKADPAFVRLCAVQQCFRARLTPKPWRCDMPLPPGSHPRDAPMQAALTDWLTRYDQASANFASCRFIEAVGNGGVSDAVRPVLELHDRLTRATESLTLA